MNGRGKPIQWVTFMNNTRNSFKNNEHDNMFYRLILELLDSAFHRGGAIASATKMRDIITGLTGRIGFYMGLIPVGYVPVMSGDQKTYVNNILEGFVTDDEHNKQIQNILIEVCQVFTGKSPVYAEDEIALVIEAIKRHMTQTKRALKRLSSSGVSDWFTVPVLCLLNAHIKSHPDCGLLPFRWHPRGDLDLQLLEIRKDALKTVLVEIQDVVLPASIPKDPSEVERYEAYLEKYSVADTLLGGPTMKDIGPKAKELEGYEFEQPQFYIRKIRVDHPKDDIKVGPTYLDIYLADETTPPVASATPASKPAKPVTPATATKKPEEKSDSESSSGGSDTEEEIEDPQPKKRRRKQAPRKSVAKSDRPKRNKKDVSYKDQL